jgi:hypothetical protein
LLGDRGHQPVARHHAATAEGRVDETPDVTLRERAYPFLQRLERAGRIGGADQRADGRAGHHVRLEAALDQPVDDADVRPAACRAAAEGNAEARRGHGFSAR